MKQYISEWEFDRLVKQTDKWVIQSRYDFWHGRRKTNPETALENLVGRINKLILYKLNN